MTGRPDLGDLQPNGKEVLKLPSGRKVAVPLCRISFDEWDGESIHTYGGKKILSLHGEPLFAELVVLRMLEGAGWEGVWADSYRRRFRRAMEGESSAVISADDLRAAPPFQKHAAGFKKFGGCWDIVAWKGDAITFCECKRSKRDALRPSQLSWLEDRLDEGASTDQFLLVEWSVAKSTNGATLPRDHGYIRSGSLRLERGRWYAYQMLPGYTSGPYFSPIKIIELAQLDSIDLLSVEFYNAAYAEGVRNFQIDLKILCSGPNYIVGEIISTLDSAESRTAVIAELEQGWLGHILPPSMRPDAFVPNFQEYFERLSRSGRI